MACNGGESRLFALYIPEGFVHISIVPKFVGAQTASDLPRPSHFRVPS